MAKKTNTEITAKNGKSYKYFSVRRKVGMKKNKAGKWVADYRLFYGESKKDALRKFDAYMQRDSINAEKPFGEVFDWFIDNVFSVNDQLSGNTKTLYINAYKSTFEKSKITGQLLKDVTGADIQSVITSSRVSASTIRQAVKLLRRFYKYAAAQNIVNDVSGDLVLPVVKKKKTDQSVEVFTDKELRTFLDDTPKEHRLRLLVILAINTGARIGELLALTYDDITQDQIRINKALQEVSAVRGSGNKTELIIGSTKTKSSVRSVPINEAVAAAVQDHKAWHFDEMKKRSYETRYVFTTASGQLYYKSSVRKHFTRLCKSLGIAPRGFHVFRHSFGTRLAANGIPIQTVSKLMGHDNIMTTAKYYINVEDQEKRNAINALNI